MPARHIVQDLAVLGRAELLEHQPDRAHALHPVLAGDGQVDADRAVAGDAVDGGVTVGDGRHGREDHEGLQAERDTQHIVLGTDAAQRVEGGVEDRRVHGEPGRAGHQPGGQHDLRQGLGVALVQRFDGLERGPVAEAEVAEVRVDAGVGHLRDAAGLDGGEVEGGRGEPVVLLGVLGAALREGGAGVAGAAVDLVVHGGAAAGGQADLHRRGRLVQHDRVAPDDVAQHDGRGAGGQPGGRVRHLQVRDAGQQDLAVDDVVAQIERFTAQRLAELHSGHRGGVAVQERVQRLGHVLRLGCCPGGPVGLSGERVAGQPDCGPGPPGQVGPLQFVALAVQVGQRPQDLALLTGSAGRVTGAGEQFVAVAGQQRLGAEVAGHRAADDRRVALVAQHPLQQPFGLLDAGDDQGAAVREVVAAGEQRRTDSREVVVCPAVQSGEQIRGLSAQRFGRFARQNQKTPRRRYVHSAPIIGRCAVHDDVGVGPADPEGAHRTAAAPAGAVRPRPGLLVDDERAARPVDVLAVLGAVQARRDGFVAQRLHQGDQAEHAGGGQGVPEGRLGGDQRALPGAVGGATVDFAERVELDGIAQRGAGAMRDDQVDLRGVDLELLVHRVEQPGLGLLAGRGDAVGAPVVVEAAGADDRVDAIAVGPRLRQRFEDHHGDRLGHHHAVGVAPERRAGCVRRQHARGGGVPVELRGGQYVDPGGEGGVAFPGAQAQAGLVHGGEPGRAGGVEAEHRPGEVQEVGQPGGQDAVVARDQGFLVAGQVLVVALFGTDEHAHALSAQPVRAVPGVLQGAPGFLQQQPLARIHALGVRRGDFEEHRVELGGTGQPAAADVLGVHAGKLPPGGQPVGGQGADGGAPFGEQLPHLVDRARTREPATHADHRDLARVHVLLVGGGAATNRRRFLRRRVYRPRGRRCGRCRRRCGRCRRCCGRCRRCCGRCRRGLLVIRAGQGIAVLAEQELRELTEGEMAVEHIRGDLHAVALGDLHGQPGIGDGIESVVGHFVTGMDAPVVELQNAHGDLFEIALEQFLDLRHSGIPFRLRCGAGGRRLR